MDRTAHRRARRTALLGVSALALVFAAAPNPGYAQAFAGSHSVPAGDATVTPGATVTTIDVKAPRTVINWVPSAVPANGVIPFLPEDTTAAFISTNLSDYTVLNRILPDGTSPIGLYGTITSSVSSGGSEPFQVPGGNVWFYTPNGFIVGPKAVISVGGLLLTTNDVLYTDGPNGVSFTDANGAVNLRGIADSKAAISIDGTALIAGNNPNSYIAMVAPRIEQAGIVRADRSIAYVAGEQVDLTIDAGMFGITVLTGTTDKDGIVHTGSTGGGASGGFFDPKTISFVAIPKNDAMTMLLSGNIGYAPAESVFNDGASIVLTAGDGKSPDGNIRIGTGIYANRLSANATGTIEVAGSEPANPEGQEVRFQRDTSLYGNRAVNVTADAGVRITAEQGLALGSQQFDGNGGSVTVRALGGSANLAAGSIEVASYLDVSATGNGGTSDDETTGFDATGGTVTIAADGGSISAGSIYGYATGSGGSGYVRGGEGRGGTVTMTAGYGGTISTSYASLDASGSGGYLYSDGESTGGVAGDGYGGTVNLADSGTALGSDTRGGALALGSLRLDASADGGYTGTSEGGSGTGRAGNAFGGTVNATIDHQSQSWNDVYATANAHDGNTALDPIGGTINFTVGGGTTLDIGGTLILEANAVAGFDGGPGAVGMGGTVNLTVEDESSLTVGYYARLNAEASNGGFYSYYFTPDSTADLTGGTINVKVDGDSLFRSGDLYLSTNAYNIGATSYAGFAKGGTINLTASDGGAIETVSSEGYGGFFQVSAEGYGGNGPFATVATGGAINLAALSGGRIAAGTGTIQLFANAEATRSFEPCFCELAATGFSLLAVGDEGVDATGGDIAIDAIGGTIASQIVAEANGSGGDASGAGGDGAGGSIAVRVLEGGSLTGALQASAYGQGGESFDSGDGGDGRGGAFTLTSDALAQFTDFSIDFQGYGEGGEATAGEGGDGYGGTAQVDLIGGEINWSSANFNLSAGGAQSRGSGSLAGSAYGDETGSRFHVGGGASLSLGQLSIDASAYADANGDGNEAIGGAAGVLVDGGASLSANSIGIGASGYLLDFSFDPNSTETTPTVRGGTASLVADGGSITSSLIEVIADADTAGALTSAGTATGGTATVGAANSGSISLELDFGCEGRCFGGLYVQANGYGGEGPSAAHATGGTATLYTHGGSINSPYELSVSADALAGSYAGYFDEFSIPSNGFDATGGTASVEMRSGGSGMGAIFVPSLSVSAQGRADDLGSVIGNGGKGTGGTATLSVEEGALDASFGLQVVASGYGGEAAESEESSTPFAGGDGEGGTANFILSGGSVTTPAVSVEAAGYGANGESFNEGATASLAGDGTGGDATFRATGGALITLGFGEGGGDFSVNGSGFGGQGAFDQNGGVGGTGGNGAGGSALFEAPAGSTADLDIGVPISVLADGVGGSAGFSTSETYGTGGKATGGDAAMRLADIPFAFGHVFISGSGYGGFGETGGVGDGGSAEFSLVDSGNAATTRSLGLLTLAAIGVDYSGLGPSGLAGTVVFNARAGSVDAGLAIDGDLLFDASGAVAPAGNGFSGTISGAPVTVGGAARLLTPRDAVLNITAPGALAVTGDLTIDVGRTFTSTGAISTLANASVIAPGGIAMTDLSASGTTLLQAVNGPVTVSRNLVSGGLVTVLGRSVNLVSLGALGFADADATAGDLAIRTAGNLDLVTVDATGAVTLTSTGGTIHNTGAVNGTDLTFIAGGDVISDTSISANGNLTVDAGGSFVTPDASASATGNVSLSADLGLDLASVFSGGTTLLQADAGAVDVASLTSAGAVTASGRSLTIGSPGALSFTSAQATAGNLQIGTAGALTIGSASASGTTSLVSTGGALSVTNLLSGGLVTARGTAVTIGSTGALSFADLDATAGNVAVTTAGNLAVATVDATGSITLISTGGSLQTSGALNGVGITLGSFANLTLTSALSTSGAISLTSTNGAVSASSPVTAGGTLAVSGLTGVTLNTASSGGATSLTAANGAVQVTALTSAGSVTARGRAVTLGSPGALTFADLDATAGNIAVTAAGNLAVSTVDATGSVSLTSTAGALSASGAINGNGIALSSAANLALTQALNTAGAISLTSTAGSVTAGNSVTAGGNLAVSGQTGVTLGTANSGGTTSLAAANGVVAVTNLASAGAVSAVGRAVTLASTGALTVSSAQATAGNLILTTGQGLTIGTAGATGTVSLSAGGNLSTTGSVTGAGITLAGANVTTGGAVQSSAALTLSAQQLLTINALATGTAINSTSGDIAIGSAGRLGSRGLTQTLRITNQSASAPINFGGAGANGQFSLDQAEAARLFADQSITIAARSTEGGGGDIRIGALMLSYGTASTANIGSGGTLKVDTAGNVIVNGAVALTTSSAGDTFSIDPQRIEVIAGSGAISMIGSGGAPLGTLTLEAGTIIVADQSVIDAIGSSSDLITIKQLLDQPTSSPSDGGYLQAGSIDVLAGDALYIQNTGTSSATTARRGFTAGALNIDTGTSGTKIVINGVIAGPTGTLTGRQAIDSITINGSPAAPGGAFDPLSTINGCIIGSACTAAGAPTSSDLESPTATDLGGPGLSGELIQLDETEPLITPPLVDEPITGVGNDDLWQVHCDPEDDKSDCPAGEGETPE